MAALKEAFPRLHLEHYSLAARKACEIVHVRLSTCGVVPKPALREKLPVALLFRGPLILEEAGTTTVITPGSGDYVYRFGNVVIERRVSD